MKTLPYSGAKQDGEEIGEEESVNDVPREESSFLLLQFGQVNLFFRKLKDKKTNLKL